MSANANSKTLTVRLTVIEHELIERAAASSQRLGERGGVSAWVRRVLLAEATRLAETSSEKTSANKESQS